MGAVAACCNEGLTKLLMPAEGSYTRDWYGFGPAERNSLLLVGHVKIEVADVEAARRFFVEGLGANIRSPQECRSNELCVFAGASELLLSAAPGREPRAWPGQFYVWVEDIQAVSAACKALQAQLGKDLILEELCLKSEEKVDVIVLQEPSAGHVIMVNQAPKGYTKMVEAAGVLKGGGLRRPNLLALMDVQYNVPSGASHEVAGFYRKLLGASGKVAEDACKVDFASGEAVRQALTFKEDEGLTSTNSEESAPASLCLYLPSAAKFAEAFQKCSAAGIVIAPAGGWQGAEQLQEFRFQEVACGSTVLRLEHVIRSPLHPDCPVQAASADGPLVGA